MPGSNLKGVVIMAEQMRSAKRHKLTIDNRERLTATGILKVDFCSNDMVSAQTEIGQLNIKGVNLQIEDLSAEKGELLVTGSISAVSYTQAMKSEALFSKLFK